MAYTLDTICKHFYRDSKPEFGQWQKWFAWRPVKMLYWYTDEIFTVEHPMKMSRTVWLKPVIRRRVTWQEGWQEYSHTDSKWQYTTFEELMRWG